ncbi:hypothetical protein MKW98_021706 [Papaver atlanticum]|uniref:Uncharacterized protein n=1 Tax=Papaver atlanticum TaxID=357466 RepID=A0AAD4XCP1_9MAGN|nr:hypothetical protein MKW98_021706 [Papaver atlanticum]
MSGGGTLTSTARTLETTIRLSKLKLRSEPTFLYDLWQVTKDDVDSALKVMNFAIYHKELAEMEERELVREKELAKKQKADRAADTNNRASGGETTDPMKVDEPPTAPQATHAFSPERQETVTLLKRLQEDNRLMIKEDMVHMRCEATDGDRYIKGDYRFRHGYLKHNPRQTPKTWAENDMRKRMRKIRAAPCLKDSNLSEDKMDEC